MADSRLRIRIGGVAEASSGYDFTPYVLRFKMNEILNQVSSFELVLLGSTDTTYLVAGSVVEAYWGTSMSTSNRFFKGIIGKIEEQTAKRIKIIGKGAGWAQLTGRRHEFRKEWGDNAREATSRNRAYVVDKLISLDLEGSGGDIVDVNTIDSSSTNVPFFNTEYEYRHIPLIRCAEEWGTDIFFTQNAVDGDDELNLTSKGSDKTSTAVFNFTGVAKNAKIGSNVLDVDNQFTRVVVIGAGDGYTQVYGRYPDIDVGDPGAYSPSSPEREKVVFRPDLKTNAECAILAQAIHGVVSAEVRRIRFSPSKAGDWLTAIETGDEIRIGTSNLVNLSAPFDTIIYEMVYEFDYELGKNELVLQCENRLERSHDTLSTLEMSMMHIGGSSRYEGTGLNMLRDRYTQLSGITRTFLTQGGFIGKMGWFTLTGETPNATLGDEVCYPIRLGQGGTYFAGHAQFEAGQTSDPAPGGVVIREGAFYYNSSTKSFRVYDGSSWIDVGSGAPTAFWGRTVGPPNYLSPLTAGDDVYPNGTADLGATGTRWDNIYANNVDFAGNVVLGSDSADTVAVNGLITTNLVPSGTTLTIGAPSSSTWANIYLNDSGEALLLGDVELGTTSSQTIKCAGRIISDIIPNVDDTYDLGTSSLRWAEIYGAYAMIDDLEVYSINISGTLGVSTLTVSTTLQVDGNTTLGNASTDTITCTGRFSSHIIPSASTYDLGQNASPTWRDLWLSGNADMLGNLSVGGNVDLGDAATDTITCTGRFDADLIPLTDNLYDLGTTLLRWAEIYGAYAMIDEIDVTTLNISGSLGMSTLTVSTLLQVDGNTILGNASTDTITCTGQFSSHLIPSAINTYDLGQNSSQTWRDLWLYGNATIGGNLSVSGTISGSISFTNLTVTGNTTLGDATSDTITFTGRAASGLLPGTTGVYALGDASYEWANIFTQSLTVSGSFIGNGNCYLGNASTDTITCTGQFSSNIIPDTTSTHDLGSPSLRFNTIYGTDGDFLDDVGVGGSLIVAGDVDSDLTPSTTATYNLGSSSYYWNEAYITSITISGNTVLGNASTDTVTINGKISSNIYPSSSGTYSLGNVSNAWLSFWSQYGSITYDFNVGGTLTKGSGSFLIDHPIDPVNKNLKHSFVESPEMMNIYKGRGKLKDKKCKITMPDWFHPLNGKEGFEYSLTPIGKLSRLAISKELEDSSFEVIGDEDCYFSWVVYAVRHDRFAEANRIQVEELKAEPGKYIHPEVWLS